MRCRRGVDSAVLDASVGCKVAPSRAPLAITARALACAHWSYEILATPRGSLVAYHARVGAPKKHSLTPL